jgi:hypothetical protein
MRRNNGPARRRWATVCQGLKGAQPAGFRVFAARQQADLGLLPGLIGSAAVDAPP